jgi:hypothetical protein
LSRIYPVDFQGKRDGNGQKTVFLASKRAKTNRLWSGMGHFMQVKKPERDKKGRFMPGNQARKTHAAYGGKMSLAIRRSSSLARLALIRDLGPMEGDLSAAQVILIDKAVNLLQITQAIEGWIRINGAMKKNRLQPVLENYIAFVNSLRLILRELGISKRTAGKILTPLELAAEVEVESRESSGEGKIEAGTEGKKMRRLRFKPRSQAGPCPIMDEPSLKSERENETERIQKEG